MLMFDEARERGFRACIDKIGYEFCLRNKENIAYAHGTKIENGFLYCWVGVGEGINSMSETGIERKYLVFATCYVDVIKGEIYYEEDNRGK